MFLGSLGGSGVLFLVFLRCVLGIVFGRLPRVFCVYVCVVGCLANVFGMMLLSFYFLVCLDTEYRDCADILVRYLLQHAKKVQFVQPIQRQDPTGAVGVPHLVGPLHDPRPSFEAYGAQRRGSVPGD